MICVCLCSVIEFFTRTIGVSFGSITKQFDWICRDQIDYQDIDRHDVTKEKQCLFNQSKKQKQSVLNETKGETISHWFHCLVCRLHQANEHCQAFMATHE